MRIAFLVATLMLAQPADAGAWMRDDGAVFLSFSGSLDKNGQQNGSVYAEYGFREKLTLGLKGDVDMIDGVVSGGSVYVFARKPIPTGERAIKLAYEVGLGSSVGTTMDPLVRVGLNYGRGINLWEKSGWIALDGAVEWNTGTETATTKLDATIGVTLSERLQVMVQVFHTEADHYKTTTLAPSVIWRPKADRVVSYQLGVEADDDGLGFKLGVWRSF